MVDETKSFYSDLEVMPIYNFDKCLNDELRFIYLSKNGEITEEIKKEWTNLFNKYCDLTVNSEILRYYRLISELNWLEQREIFVPALLNQLLKTPKDNREDIYKELKAWKTPVKSTKEAHIKQAITILNNSKNKINRKKAELEELQKKNERIKSVKSSLQQQKSKLNRFLGVNVNIFECSVIQWLAHWKEAEELSKSKTNVE